MKLLALTTVVSLACLPRLQADQPPASFLRNFSLDERTPYQIPVALNRGMTTLVFPEPPQNFAAPRVTFAEPGHSLPDVTSNTQVDFIVLAQRGTTTCSIRAVRPDAQDTLSVFLGGKVYQLFLRANGDQPLLTVEFHYPQSRSSTTTDAVSPNRLIDCLTRAKAYPILQKYYPNELDDITHVSSERVITYPDFRVQVSDVFRFDAADTLVFHILLQNQTDHEIRYRRSELSVRVEPQTSHPNAEPPLYNASVVDASGVMPPGSVTSAWFAITGTRDGGRNNLDPARNIFTVLVPRADFSSTPTLSVRPGAVTDPKSISF
jgi:hypothetical protein